jgi:DNA-binding response OmpR family regulator
MLRRIIKRDISRQIQICYPRSTVLLIDTNPLDLETYSEIFRGLGHEVVNCASYADGVRHLLSGNFDLVVVDQGGPTFEGRLVLEKLNELGQNIPILVLARHKDMHCYLRALELGAADYFEKPVSSGEISRAVQAYLPLRVSIGPVSD